MNLTLLITIGVPLFFVFAVIYSDRFREPTDLVIKTFIAGTFVKHRLSKHLNREIFT